MENENAEVVETEEMVEDRDGLDIDLNADGDADFMSGYDDDDNPDTAEEHDVEGNDEEAGNETELDAAQQTETDDAEESSEEETEDETPNVDADDEAEPSTQKWEVKHLDDTFQMSGDEMVPYARKGLDYDRIREGYDIMAKDYAEAKYALDVLETMKGDFATVADLVDDIVARQILEENDTEVSDKTLNLVKKNAKDRRDAAIQSYSMNQMREANRKTQKDKEIDHFMEVYNGVPASELTQDVWDFANKHNATVTEAYMAKVINNLTKEKNDALDALKVAKQNNKNASKSISSAKNKGAKANDDKVSDFMKGYLDDDEW